MAQWQNAWLASEGCGFEPNERHCAVSFSKILYHLLSIGSTQEYPF